MPQSDLEQHSLALQKIIKDKISEKGSISFAEFMHMSLYQPGFGYYSSGHHKFGKDGDFVTAPELGCLFAKNLALQISQVIKSLDNPVILELGAGTGQFAYDCLLELEKLKTLPENYFILEVSADLQQRQVKKIQSLPKHLSDLVKWISQPLANKFNGVVFANEVVDALPVEVFRYYDNEFQQMRVAWDEGFKKTWGEFPEKLLKQIEDKNLQLNEGYISEFIPHLNSWLNSITQNLNQGVVIFVDYGYERNAYYHPQRSDGTLICFYQHQANFDYFSNIGIQDMTAFVDFTALAEAADSCGLEVDGFTTQAHFLMSLGIQNHLGDSQIDYENYYKNTTEMKKLTMPNEMGEKFKVIAFSKNYADELIGFTFSNQLHLL
jgi:SAM-dependent MidA family methyltransferase